MGHLRENGFEVKTEDVADMAPVKARFGVQPQHEGCHTAVVDGYVIEGPEKMRMAFGGHGLASSHVAVD